MAARAATWRRDRSPRSRCTACPKVSIVAPQPDYGMSPVLPVMPAFGNAAGNAQRLPIPLGNRNATSEGGECGPPPNAAPVAFIERIRCEEAISDGAAPGTETRPAAA